jgi:uncharacterized repeat protein (TIGR04076 family)
MGKDLKITIIEISGTCPVYQTGDSFYLDSGYILDPSRSCRVCMHSLASILPYHVALSHDVAPTALGLNKKDEHKAFVQCLDPCAYTGGGTVILEVEIMK